MLVNRVPAKQWLRAGLIAIVLTVAFQTAMAVGQMAGYQLSYHQALDAVERRISLDSAYLDVGNKTLNTPVNEAAVSAYLHKLNRQLDTQTYPLRISQMQTVASPESIPAHFQPAATLTMQSAEQTLSVHIASVPWWQAWSLSHVSLLLGLGVAPLVARIQYKKKQRLAALQPQVDTRIPHLVIDLTSKTLGNGVNDTRVTMHNKPFCFYVALVRYCIEHPDCQLMHHTDVPAGLISQANQVFGRLIELGHTKRKRPDFNANLDKTLSEIRSALEEVFAEFAAQKEKYYPPRAQGEGSRSKQHSFALPHLCMQDIEIIGN